MSGGRKNHFLIWLKVARVQFLSASAIPVVVGTAMAYAMTGAFSGGLFALALVGIMLIHAGANLANEYYDDISGNDRRTRPSALFGGSGVIQSGAVAASDVHKAAVLSLAAGSACGLAILAITRSPAILAAGIIGIAGGYFYTATPIKLAYRTLGEPTIALLFGILPVWAAAHIQGAAGPAIVLAGAIVSLLIFEVILANEFPDAEPDAASNKRTLAVALGKRRAAGAYIVVMVGAYLLPVAGMFLIPNLQRAWLAGLTTFPLAAVNLALLRRDALGESGRYTFNLTTIILHGLYPLAMVAGMLSGK